MKGCSPYKRAVLFGMNLERYGSFRCDLCKIEISREVKLRKCNRATIDHIIPKSRGGTNNISNLRWVCRMCNQRKSNNTDEEMYKIYG